jgi:hypothetical protein
MQGIRLLMLTKRCLNVNCYLKDQNLYYSTIRPVVTNAFEAWVLKDNSAEVNKV